MKKILIFVFTFVLLCLTLTSCDGVISGKQTPSEGLTFTMNNDGVSCSISGIGTCTDTELILPTTYNDLPITAISSDAFRDCAHLQSITIPSGIIKIGEGAFIGCEGLMSVYITDITAWCQINFENFSANPLSKAKRLYVNGDLLENLHLPKNISKIGAYAFYNCSVLKEIEIPNNIVEIGDCSFYGCMKITEIEIPTSITRIGNSAFAGCSGLTSIEVPDSVTYIGSSAFGECSNLESIKLPFIGNTKDEAWPLSRIFNYNLYGVWNIPSKLKVVIITGGNKVVSGAFSNCANLTSIQLPESITEIGERAFYSCEGLASIKIPKNVTTIGNSAFEGCTGLTSISIPDNVATIGNDTFRDCTNLTTVEFNEASKLNNINRLFYGCTALTSVIIPQNVMDICKDAFKDCINLNNVTFQNIDGWQVKKGSDAVFLNVSALSNPETAAMYLRNQYCAYSWTRDADKYDDIDIDIEHDFENNIDNWEELT